MEWFDDWPDGRVIDGMHRIARALVEQRKAIGAVRLPVLPPLTTSAAVRRTCVRPSCDLH